jgi:hypothetical protein
MRQADHTRIADSSGIQDRVPSAAFMTTGILNFHSSQSSGLSISSVLKWAARRFTKASFEMWYQFGP